MHIWRGRAPKSTVYLARVCIDSRSGDRALTPACGTPQHGRATRNNYDRARRKYEEPDNTPCEFYAQTNNSWDTDTDCTRNTDAKHDTFAAFHSIHHGSVAQRRFFDNKTRDFRCFRTENDTLTQNNAQPHAKSPSTWCTAPNYRHRPRRRRSGRIDRFAGSEAAKRSMRPLRRLRPGEVVA
jgi:hypothetical protein